MTINLEEKNEKMFFYETTFQFRFKSLENFDKSTKTKHKRFF